ncbi:hypothetical protein BSL78_23392 [Apostichopus japonicus]|uniref:DUF7886 domain-containing protein n=2 Tax=Stichopus japonicus TaxID=307972 RepID=A0A2G8JVH5_STIJA|nr:hypothetical protein BSL78_23392 [Apostichopus japonicus]
MLAVGCVRGFKYFSMYLRGKEEMVCTVLNEPVTPRSSTPVSTEGGQVFFSGSQPELPVDQKDLMLSQGTQKRLSGYGYMDIGLPPASPSEREITPARQDSTLFLLAGYGKYSCPYVWVRSNHDRLVKLNEENKCNKDSPLRLKTTSAWNEKDIRAWEILAELVKLNTRPSPSNPFAVDLQYFDSLDIGERVIALGAMSHLLQQIFSHGPDKAYAGLVADDLKEVTRRHFKDLLLLMKQHPQSAVQSSHVRSDPANKGQLRTHGQGQRSYSQGYK